MGYGYSGASKGWKKDYNKRASSAAGSLREGQSPNPASPGNTQSRLRRELSKGGVLVKRPPSTNSNLGPILYKRKRDKVRCNRYLKTFLVVERLPWCGRLLFMHLDTWLVTEII